MHVSKRTFGTFVLPYLARAMANEKVDPVQFAVANFDDSSVGESLAKEIERARK
jgi:hypothetical protein